MLAAVALNHLDQTFLSHSNIRTAGIYLDYRQATAQTFENVFSGLLAQLIEHQRPLKETVRGLHKKHSDQNTRPSLAEITDIIETEVRTCKLVHVVVDALDEFEDFHRKSLTSRLKNLGPTVRLMITSRQITLSQDFLAAAIPLDICAPDEDIRIYTQDRIANDDRLSRFVSRATDLEDLIVTTVLEMMINITPPRRNLRLCSSLQNCRWTPSRTKLRSKRFETHLKVFRKILTNSTMKLWSESASGLKMKDLWPNRP